MPLVGGESLAASLFAILMLSGPGSAHAQTPVPASPRSRIAAGFSLNLPPRATIEADGQAGVSATAERTSTGEMFIAYQRWLGERVGVEGSVHFMSVPAAVSYDVYSLADTVGGVSGPLGRQTMRLGDWSKFGFQVNVFLKLLDRHRSDLSFIVGSRVLSLPDARISYSAGLDQLYSANLNSITIVGAYDRLISFGAVGGLRFTTRSKNDNGLQVTLLGAWFQDEGFTGTLYTLPGTSLERQAKYIQSQSFIGVSVALYKSWGPPKVPMRLRKDREP